MGIADSDREEGRDIEFAGTAARRTLEKKLLWKIDRRMSILVLTYILNYVSRIHFDEDGFCFSFFKIDRNNTGCVCACWQMCFRILLKSILL